jgi:hypothetical protein
MRKLLAVMITVVLLFAALVQPTMAREVCSTQSVSCLEADALLDHEGAQGRSRRADGARLTGMAAYYSRRAAYGPRADSARYQALADHYANLRWDPNTLSREHGLGALYGR